MTADSSFETFVCERRPALVQLGWALTGDRQHGEDLAQLTLDRVWRRWAKVVQGGDPWPYVQRTAVTLAHTWRRRRWHGEKAAGLELVSAISTDGDGSDPDLRLVVEAWLRALPAGQRSVVVLRFLCDLPVDEVADLLSCSTGTVKSQTAKALDALRGHLQTTITAGEAELR